jgi:hypothetical protein
MIYSFSLEKDVNLGDLPLTHHPGIGFANNTLGKLDPGPIRKVQD